MRIDDGKSVNVVCIVAGYPEPNVRWSAKPTGSLLVGSLVRNAGAKSTYSRQLLLKEVLFDKNGTEYTCTASGNGMSDSKKIILKVRGTLNLFTYLVCYVN